MYAQTHSELRTGIRRYQRRNSSSECSDPLGSSPQCDPQSLARPGIIALPADQWSATLGLNSEMLEITGTLSLSTFEPVGELRNKRICRRGSRFKLLGWVEQNRSIIRYELDLLALELGGLQASVPVPYAGIRAHNSRAGVVEMGNSTCSKNWENLHYAISLRGHFDAEPNMFWSKQASKSRFSGPDGPLSRWPRRLYNGAQNGRARGAQGRLEDIIVPYLKLPFESDLSGN